MTFNLLLLITDVISKTSRVAFKASTSNHGRLGYVSRLPLARPAGC